MRMSFRDLRRKISDSGFVLKRESPHGELWVKRQGDRVLQTTIPRGRDNETVPKGLLAEILRQTQLSREELDA